MGGGWVPGVAKVAGARGGEGPPPPPRARLPRYPFPVPNPPPTPIPPLPLQLFTPLVEKCKALNRAMRIGTNHGSLSARILSYYGDTPRGMVSSAFEFADICRDHDYHNFLFSMKASNPLVMVQAYRLLAEEQYARGWDYPLHLGVTEARGWREGVEGGGRKG